jgi:oxygen-independent coproporphyrinogen-3 oxidase
MMKSGSYFKALVEKYDIPAPRYTSYPTVPYWTDSPTTSDWIQELQSALNGSSKSWAMYIHVPFCETLCTFCGCNNAITKDHSLERHYVDLILREWSLYQRMVPELSNANLKQIHLGGGSPTFLSAANLSVLLEGLFKEVNLADRHLSSDFEGAIEVDPRRTTKEQLRVLREFGFDRVSLGVQDFNPIVQKLVNRIQPFEMTKKITEEARSLGYRSINYDLIYGLPKQSPESVRETALLVRELMPDRIALYSFAKVPWIKPAQRLFKDEDLPQGEDKRILYDTARSIFLDAGYVEIGMDHFALPQDTLALANLERRLHRNFMGYTDQRTDALLGLGVSAISETESCYHQNEKIFPLFERRIQRDEIPTLRGHRLSDLDLRRRKQILNLMTRWSVELESDEQAADVRSFLKEMLQDGLVELQGRVLSLTPQGRPFLRNACMALDSRLRHEFPEKQVFSSSL